MGSASKPYERVTDTCIPEEEAFRKIAETHLQNLERCRDNGERFLPHEFMYKLILGGELKPIL